MTRRREKVGIVGALMPELIASLELADSPLLPTIREAQHEEVTHLLLLIERDLPHCCCPGSSW